MQRSELPLHWQGSHVLRAVLIGQLHQPVVTLHCLSAPLHAQTEMIERD